MVTRLLTLALITTAVLQTAAFVPHVHSSTRPSRFSSMHSSPQPADILRLDKILTVELSKANKLSSELERSNNKLKKLEAMKDAYLMGKELDDARETNKETTARSGVKSLCWRIIAGSVTLITSLKFTGSMSTALKIVSSDFFSKSATMFIGERMMNRSQAGRSGAGDGVGRSLTKALIWRLFAVANTLTMAIFISKDLSMASKIAGSDAIVKTAMMFVYERVWSNVDWGKEYDVEFEI